MALTRRELIALAGAGLAGRAVAALSPSQGRIPTRKLGKIAPKVAIYGVGTAEIPGDDEAVAALDRLIDAGVNYVDTAPSYTGTRSEQVVGQVMARRRKEVVLATKTLARDADGAYAEVQASLKRLRTDRIDLLQVHSVNEDAALDRVLAKGGAVQGLERARKEGLIGHIGITGHTRPEVILRAIREYPFASILVPTSAMDAHLHDFVPEVVAEANRRGIAVVGMKALKGMERAKGGRFDAGPLLRYAWSLPVACVVVGLRRGSEVDQNLAVARGFRPMSKADRAALEASVKPDSDAGHLWWKAR